MKDKTLIYIIIALLILLLAVVIIKFDIFKDSTSSATNNNPELEKYRSTDIPEECRLPDYESDLEWWKQHLSHHQNTVYCLDYYK